MADLELVLVVGGSGYLGLHILHSLASSASRFRIAFTYFSDPPPPLSPDLCPAQGFKPRVVINCAAVSVPRECELDPEKAMATNIPSALLQWLSSLNAAYPPLLIHLSTDQVYEGTKSFYKEEDETKPVNVYGRSKVQAEDFIKEHWSNYAILRSSIIYGPQPFIPIRKSLPIQWIHNALTSGNGAEFFHDEYRCPVFVKDVVAVILKIIEKEHEGDKVQLLLNVGGPTRLSRADMAEIVAEVKGIDNSLIKRVSAASVNRGVASPTDISMDVSKCLSELKIKLTPFHQGVELTLVSSN